MNSYSSKCFRSFESYAYQLVNAAQVYQNLVPLKNNDKKVLLPNNEVQIRSLSALPKEMQQSILLKAVELSAGEHPTGKNIKLLVDNLSKESRIVFRKVSKAIQKDLTDERRIKRINTLEEESRNFVPITKQLGKFSVILADPPWQYEHAISENRAIENHYNTMNIEEIASLPISEICTRSAVLFLWVTNPKLQEGLYVLNKWGFTYRTGMVWVKDRIGTGYWVRSKHELLLIGIKGKMPCPEECLRPDSVIVSKRRKHSEKPDKVYEIIEKMYPSLKKIELFARREREGWKK